MSKYKEYYHGYTNFLSKPLILLQQNVWHGRTGVASIQKPAQFTLPFYTHHRCNRQTELSLHHLYLECMVGNQRRNRFSQRMQLLQIPFTTEIMRHFKH